LGVCAGSCPALDPVLFVDLLSGAHLDKLYFYIKWSLREMLVLSQTCEYALRAMTHIAQHGDGRPILAKEIAGKTNVPLKYLQKILRDLVRERLLSSSRGIGGGFRLGRPASKLRLIDVIEPFEGARERTSCPFGNPLCGKANPCLVHKRWARAVKPYRSFLEGTTLADLIRESVRKKKTQQTRRGVRKAAAKAKRVSRARTGPMSKRKA
jgi:Rrf2 family protein